MTTTISVATAASPSTTTVRFARGTAVWLSDDPEAWYARPNGTTTYLHRRPDCKDKPAGHAFSTKRLAALAVRVLPPLVLTAKGCCAAEELCIPLPYIPLVPPQAQSDEDEEDDEEGAGTEDEDAPPRTRSVVARESSNNDDSGPGESKETSDTGLVATPASIDEPRVPSRFVYVIRDLDAGPDDRRVKIGISGNIAATLRTYRRRLPNDHVVLVADLETEPAARRMEECFALEFSGERDAAKHEVYRVRVTQIADSLKRRGYRPDPDGVFRKAVVVKTKSTAPKK